MNQYHLNVLIMKTKNIEYSEWKRLLADFTVNMRSQNYASAKGECYINNVLDFICWLEYRSIRGIKNVKAHHVYEYMVYLRERPNRRRPGTLSEKTVKDNLFSIRLLFDYAYACGMIEYTVPFPKFIRHDAESKKTLSTDEIMELFEVCQNALETAILTLAYGCGLRRKEIYRLNSADVATHLHAVYIVEGKGRKSRSVPLSSRAVGYLREYERYFRPAWLMKNRSAGIEAAYLLNDKGKRMSAPAIYECVTGLAQRTGNPEIIAKNVTPHLLRHSIATHLLQNGAGLEWTQAFLGHSNPDSTHIYVKNRLAKLNL